ncbi:unnamed protein product, partial [Effrenium voratum]
ATAASAEAQARGVLAVGVRSGACSQMPAQPPVEEFRRSGSGMPSMPGMVMPAMPPMSVPTPAMPPTSVTPVPAGPMGTQCSASAPIASCTRIQSMGTHQASVVASASRVSTHSAMPAMPAGPSGCQVDGLHGITVLASDEAYPCQAMPSYTRGATMGAAAEFPIGCNISVLDEMVMRAEEHLKSEQVTVLEEGSLLSVLAHGGEPNTRRLYVRHAESGLCGWISCVAQSGRRLVTVVEVKTGRSHTPTPSAAVTMRSERSDGTEMWASDPKETEWDRGVTAVAAVQSQRSAAGVTATTVTTSYPPQIVSDDPVPSGQWLRRQKAQDLNAEAPKRYLVDNRSLNAGTEGINYRFTKDLEDLDLSCTAPWGSLVEGVVDDGWLRVSDDLYLPIQLGGATVLTLEDSPWALSGLQVVEAFPVGGMIVVLEAAIMRAAEDMRSAALAQLEKERAVRVLGHGSGARSRRLYVQDPLTGQDGWISFASQNGKLLVAPSEASPDEVQKVATQAAQAATLATAATAAAAAASHAAQAPDCQESERAFFVDNRTFKADSDGIGYRGSQDLDDKAVPARTALWGSVIHGVDLGDWVRVGAYFLPTTLCGVQVLTPKEDVPATHLPQQSGFARGNWEYICIDPQGVQTRLQPEEVIPKNSKTSGQAVQPGEMIRICERGILGQTLWLCLMDGRGWVTEKSSRRHLSEVNDEGAAKGQKLMVDPRLDKPVKLFPAPFSFGSVAGAPELLAGETVVVLRKVLVLVPSGSQESWVRYLKVEDERKIEGWLGELRIHCGIKGPAQSEPVLHEFKAGFGEQRSKSPWVSVIAKAPVPLLSGPSRTRGMKKSLSPGDFVEAVEELSVAGLTFYRLADGCWVAREEAGKVVCDLLTRESHKWIYVCNDKDGAQVRLTPTRSNAKNTGKRLKYRQRVMISEKVTFADNDVFLKLSEEKKGWVPANKLNSNVVKMAALKALEPEKPKGPAAYTGNVPNGNAYGNAGYDAYGYGYGSNGYGNGCGFGAPGYACGAGYAGAGAAAGAGYAYGAPGASDFGLPAAGYGAGYGAGAGCAGTGYPAGGYPGGADFGIAAPTPCPAAMYGANAPNAPNAQMAGWNDAGYGASFR